LPVDAVRGAGRAGAVTAGAFVITTVGPAGITIALAVPAIAAIDPSQPTHLTAWSPWVAGTAH